MGPFGKPRSQSIFSLVEVVAVTVWLKQLFNRVSVTSEIVPLRSISACYLNSCQTNTRSACMYENILIFFNLTNNDECLERWMTIFRILLTTFHLTHPLKRPLEYLRPQPMTDIAVWLWYVSSWRQYILHRLPDFSVHIRLSHCLLGVNQLSLTPPVRPKTSSSTFHSDTSELTSAIVPENSTPRTVDDPAGGGYLPSLWEISNLFKPNARI